MSMTEKLKLAATGLIVALAVIGVTSLFVDLRATFGQIVDTIKPYDAEQIEIEASAFQAYFTIDKRRVESGKLIVTIARTPRYPQSDQQAQRMLAAAEPGLDRLAMEAMVRGYITAELFDEKNKFITSAMLRIRPLRSHETLALSIPLPARQRLGRLRLTY